MWPAAFNDARIADTRQVEVRIEGSELLVLSHQGIAIDRWPVGNIRLVTPPAGRPANRLRRHPDTGARLALSAPEDMAALLSRLPHPRTTLGEHWKAWRRTAALGGLALASILFLQFVAIPASAPRIAKALPDDFVQRIGETTRKQVLAFIERIEGREDTGVVCTQAYGNLVIDAAAEQLLQGREGAKVHVVVVDSPLVNAVALPGGNILVFRGLIEFLDDGNALTGVIAHEIGHSLGRDGLTSVIRASGISALFGLVLGDASGGTAVALIVQSLWANTYSRDTERRADAEAVRLLNDAGLDAQPLADFFVKLSVAHEEEKSATWLRWASGHPLSLDRAHDIRLASTGVKTSISPIDWERTKHICDP